MEKIVETYLSGNTGAFAQILAYVQPVIKQVIAARRYPGSIDNDEDLTQEFWVETLKNLSKWNPERGTLKNFLFKCFMNRAGSFLSRAHRAQNHTPIEEVQEILPSTENFDIPAELDIRIQTRITGFAEEYIFRKVWTAIYMRVYNTSKKSMIKELKRMTGVGHRRIKFLMDYAAFILRQRYAEVGCNQEFSTADSKN